MKGRKTGSVQRKGRVELEALGDEVHHLLEYRGEGSVEPVVHLDRGHIGKGFRLRTTRTPHTPHTAGRTHSTRTDGNKW
jgi:hypothetical protein